MRVHAGDTIKVEDIGTLGTVTKTGDIQKEYRVSVPREVGGDYGKKSKMQKHRM